MSKNQITHEMNYSNLKVFISELKQLQPKYNPVSQGITVAGFEQSYADATVVRTKLNKSERIKKDMANIRRPVYQGLESYVVRIIAAMKALEMPEATIANAQSLLAKIQGQRIGKPKGKNDDTPPADQDDNATPPADETGTPPLHSDNPGGSREQISVAQTDMDNVRGHFDKLYELLENQPSYIPNETDLQISAVLAMKNQLEQTNDDAVAAESDYNTDYANRYTVFYFPNTGFVDRTKLAKEYVKSTFGATSAEYKRIRKIRFKNIVPRKKSRK
jgi:hypothetical protein